MDGPQIARPRVLLVDDHGLYRAGMAAMLAEADLDVVAEAADGLTAIDEVERTVPDVVLMDISMEGLSGLEATRIITERSPTTRVVVLTISADLHDVTDAILAGACGYVLKDRPADEVVAAVWAAAKGETLLSPRVAAMILDRIRSEGVMPPVPTDTLSIRETEVLGLLAAGQSNPEIAAALVISPSTVRNHVSNILRKLHLENRIQAAIHASRMS